MIIPRDNKTEIDTDRDLSPEERHVLQKLLCYKAVADSLDEFREKKDTAYIVGWNNSGPIKESRALKLVVQQMEKDLRLRLQTENSD